jgi:RND family efflux transporter MFP subunit
MTHVEKMNAGESLAPPPAELDEPLANDAPVVTNGGGPTTNGSHLSDNAADAALTGDETQPIEEHAGEEAPEATAQPVQGFERIRTGFREIRSGSADLIRVPLEFLRRHLPGRLRTLSLRRLGLAVLAVLVVVVALLAGAASAIGSALAGPTAVNVATAGPAVIHSNPGGVGSISASPQHVSVIGLNVVGITAPVEVTSVDVVAGQQVVAGAPILQLNPAPFEQNVGQVGATLFQAQQTLASAQAAASSQSSGSGQAYLSVQVPTLAGEVAVDQQLYQIALGNSTSLTAPIAGNISYVRVSPGQIINPGTSMVQIVDPSTVDVSTGMQLSSLQSVSVGDTATVTPTELPGVHLQGTVIAVSASSANGGLEGTVVISATNGGNHPVPIGTQVFVNISAPVTSTVSVPTVAVLNPELNPTVGVVKNGRITFRAVQVGASDTSRTQILSGLKSGETVALSNLQVLTNGDQVKTLRSGA